MMRRTRGRILLGVLGAVAAGACASAATNVRAPLEAHLYPAAATGAPVPLRFDPNARVIRSTAADLPAAAVVASQAERGRSVYEQTCGTCHGPEDLIGQRFVESWNDRRVYDLYALVRSTMPLDDPGGMKEQEYLDVVAYLLQANHAPTGSDSIRADTAVLRQRKIAVHFP